MSAAQPLLPAGFEALEPFVQAWAVSGSANRAQRRQDSTEAERATFYNAAKDLVMPALDLLDKKPLGQLDEKERRLMDLLLTLAHISLAVEAQGDDEPRHAQARQYLRITTAPADRLG